MTKMKDDDIIKILLKLSKLPKEKQALVVGFVEGIEYSEQTTSETG